MTYDETRDHTVAERDFLDGLTSADITVYLVTLSGPDNPGPSIVFRNEAQAVEYAIEVAYPLCPSGWSVKISKGYANPRSPWLPETR